MSYSQVVEITPDLLFTIGYNYFPQYGAEDIPAARALEYHDGHLYLAFEDKVLKFDMQGNVVGIIYPNKMVRIRDIVFHNDQLVVFAPQSYDKLIFYQDSTRVKALFANFYAANEKELTNLPALPFYFEAAEYLINSNGQLYFCDAYRFLALSYLKQITVTTYQPLVGKKVFINTAKRKPVLGYPISDCEFVQWAFHGKLSNKYKLTIVDSCNGITNFFAKPLTNDTCNNCIVSIVSFFKNNYLNKYFFLGGRGTLNQRERVVVFLDENFDVEKICHSVEYLQDRYGYSPHPMASFTYDELGNVYYCTNKLDWKNKNNSIVEVFKISGK